MNLWIKRAELHEKEVLRSLMQYYFYDFSEYINIDVTDNGAFLDYPSFHDYWMDPSRFAYLIIADGKLAGFALVSYRTSPYRNFFSMDEFFVMKKYRRYGVGKKVAYDLFRMHQGNWEISEIAPNKPAQSFWRKIIQEFTNGNYRERNENSKFIQEFVS
ncbi:GNAT family N-acetyltransferase [Bacillaceae bacterium S4-13-58]